jgi:hypothetical protein
MKGGLSNSSVAINGQGGPLSLNMTPYTIYVNPYYVTEEFNNGAVTSKHYYMGTQRVATQLAPTAARMLLPQESYVAFQILSGGYVSFPDSAEM